MTGARRPNVKEPVVVEDEPKVETEKVEAPKPTPPPEKEPVAVDVESGEDPPEDQPWFPGRPCLNCGSREYKWTVGWGATCSECSPEAVAAREAE